MYALQKLLKFERLLLEIDLDYKACPDAHLKFILPGRCSRCSACC